VLDTEPGQPVTVLDHDHSRARVGKKPVQLAAAPVQPRPDLGHDLRDSQAQPIRAGHHPRDLPIQISPLIG
jgi:hypothetical protein